ncbi:MULTISPECIES: peptidylprolyl isomerase [unclassified Tenacibaculum]|uniref:peptidylprolyl isomerase n=1 Tax=unclassified Tenacibaculum TaxID=2635139 RepID=UPI001F3780C0|nr:MULTISPECIES: peptidylprolyl isomerase [unclassified Tenacibaculum]MCF2873520.1 SurA N-terminal domain-containing protein [Tenacibaculum sp. Cn5-1]MCF2933676.1 SurA N-terminal domain-containing protein [Tenacibaculum sp. Cn5-34]MCG7509742.1 SurA N-terminal domain-containing protein [Tenacibaculum sp. Cn5-46]
MAILSKIRERSMFLILVIGLALFAFVLDPSTISDFFNASKVNEVGEVNGETISRQEFAEALDAYKAQTGNRVSEMQAAKTVWNNLIRQKIYQTQLEEAGITVGDEDIMTALYDSPALQNDPRFQTSGLFDKNKLKEFLATIKDANGEEWKAWQNYMTSLKNNIEKTTYDNLVAAGLGASLKEGEAQYLIENTKVNAKFVYVPYTTIADSLVVLKKSDVANYIKKHEDEFQVEASRDIKFVKFDIKPTEGDEAATKEEVAKLINDSDNRGVVIKGLKNATDYVEFLDENDSDIALDDNYKFKVQVPQVIAEEIFNGKEGDVFGPYKDADYFKISKISKVIQLPDSAQASHILIPFVGATSAAATVTQTEEEAKKTADSLLTVVKANKSKFADLAKEMSSDKGSAEKGGFYDWFSYNRMVPSFRDFVFEGKEGDMGVVKSPFGFHVIKIDGQKNFQPVVKLVTFGRKIEASEATENAIFQDAETFALELANGKDFDEAVKEKSLTSSPAVGLKSLDEVVPGVGNEREIITWSFGNDVNEGSFKRFDIEGGYVVAVLTGITEKGLMPVDKAISRVRPILMNERKAKMIEDKISGATLADIAKSVNVIVRNAADVNLNSPTLAGVGYEPKVVGAMLNAKEKQVIKNVSGDKGVFAFEVESRELPTALPNYDTYRKRLANERKNKTFQMYEAVKKASNIEDNISSFYGIQ